MTSLRTVAGAAGLLAALLIAGCSESPETLLKQAQASVQKHDYTAAKVQLKALLQKAPRTGEARQLLARVLLASGDPAGAEAEAKRALEYGATEDSAVPVLANAMLALGKGNLIISQFGNLELHDPLAQAELKTALAGVYADTGKLGLAEQTVNEGLAKAPDHTPALLLHARLKAANHQNDEALTEVEALVKRAPNFAAALAFKGDLLLGKGQLDQALEAWHQSLRLAPDQLGVHGAIIYTLVGRNDLDGAEKALGAMRAALPKSPETNFFEAMLAESRGNHLRARELTQELLRLAPNSPRVLVLAGQAQLRLGALAQAETLFAKAIQADQAQPLPRLMLARTHLQAGLPDKAAAALAPLLEAKPPNTEALLLAGQAQMMAGNAKAAESNFSQLDKIVPNDPRLRTARAIGRLGQGNDEQALADLSSMAQEDASSRLDMVVIIARLRKNDPSGALKQVDLMERKAPASAVPEYLRGRIAMVSKDNAAARKHFAAAVAKDQNHLPSITNLAVLDFLEKQPDQARARFEALLTRQPKNARAMLAMADLSNNLGQTAEAARWLDKAVKAEPAAALPRVLQIDYLANTGDAPGALSAARAAAIALPDNLELLERLGRAEMANNQAQAAITTFGKMVTQNPQAARPLLLLAEAQAATGASAGAAASLRKANDLAPADPQVVQAVAAQAMREGKPDQALVAARRLQGLQPNQPIGYQMEGDIELSQRHWDNAIVPYRRALDPKLGASTSGDLAARLHSSMLNAGRTVEAERFSAEWQKAHPEQPQYLLHLGDLALEKGQNDVAERQYRQVLLKQPQHPMAMNNLAYLQCAKDKRGTGGLALAEQAVALAPGSPAFLDTLAHCQDVEGQLPKAVSSQQQAVKMAPENDNFRLQLAKLLLKSGDRVAARTELRTLARKGDKLPQHAEVEALSKQLGD